jgi:hypothetical protein
VSSGEKACLRLLVEVGLRHAPEMPPAARADLYQGIAVAASHLDAGLASEARRVADALREAELQQGLFDRHFWAGVEGARE